MCILAKDTGALIKGHFEGHYNGRLADELTCHSAHTCTGDSVCVCADVLACASTYEGQSSTFSPLPLLLPYSPYFFLGGVSLWIWSSSFQLDCLISEPLGWVCLYLTRSHPKSVGLQVHASTPSFYEGIEDLNSGLCACPVSIVPKETLSQIQDFLK